MTNVQYITDAQGHKTAMILPIEDYEKILKEKQNEIFFTNKLTDFEYLQKFFIKQLVLSNLDKIFEFLDIPINHSSKRKSDASLLLFALVELFYYSKEIYVDHEHYMITLKNTEFTKFLIGIEAKTIQTQINDNLVPYMENAKKSIVEINQHSPSGKKLKGTSYKLNFLETTEKAIIEFLKESNLEIKEKIDLIQFSKRIKFNEIDISNNHFKNLWKKITFNLDNLPREPKIHESNAARQSKSYQLGKQ